MPIQISIPILIEKFWETIPPAWHATRASIRAVAAEKFKLTVEQFQVLRRIRRGVDSVSALAEANRTSRSSVSKAVETLVRHGLVSRSQNAADRRQVPLALTAEGERVLAVIFEEAEVWLAEKFQPLDPQEREQVLAGMAVLQKVFE